MIRRRGLVVAMLDVTEHGVDHVVVYGGAEGLVTDYLGSRDPGPFDTTAETLQWLVRTVNAWEAPPAR